MNDEGRMLMKTKHILRVLLAGLIFLPLAANAQPRGRSAPSKPSAAKSSPNKTSSKANKASKKRYNAPSKPARLKQKTLTNKRKAHGQTLTWAQQARVNDRPVPRRRPPARRVTYNDRAWLGQAGEWEPVNPPDGPGGPANN